MNIAVLVKLSVDTSYIRLDQSNRVLFSEIPLKVSDIDRNAVEEALRIKQQGLANKISSFSVLTWGSSDKRIGEAQNLLREILAMGVDESYLYVDPGFAYSHLYTARILAKMIRKAGDYSLILAGEASIDGYSSQIPCRVAEDLGVPCVSYARRIEVKEGKVIVERDLEDSVEVVGVKLPAVVSVTREINTPRLPTLLQIRAAMRKPVNIIKASDIGLEPLKKIHEFVAEGVKIQRKGIIIEGKTVDEKIEKLLEALAKEGITLYRG
ncbi:MAG TPA: electron transfer flavoprotein subunit beta/FixA family protein [Sulfolobales archaeon]|nr:electron transfer flavoprotein subunit beta/FixA family protein [Sulfolobales archaeon]